jgi:hypothetical protein
MDQLVDVQKAKYDTSFIHLHLLLDFTGRPAQQSNAV